MPRKELERLQAVHKFLKLEFSKESEIQDIVDLIAKICGTATAMITFLDQENQHIRFKNRCDFENTARADAFCNCVIAEKELIVVHDALLDSRFLNNPLVIGDPKIRFYAGAPLITSDGHILGSLCVIDQVPCLISENQRDTLKMLAKQVIHLMEFDTSLKFLKDLYIDTKKSEIELRSFFESSIDNHLLLGRNFEILAFNKSWEIRVKNTYGLQMERGKNMIDYINPIHLKAFYKDYQTALKGTAVYDERNLKENGEDRWWIVKFEPAFNAEGEIIGVSVNAGDVNKRVENENTVKAQHKKLHEIALMQSHEFRKPVASIMGLAALLRLDDAIAITEEWQMLELAVAELDLKIKLIVGSVDQT